MATIVIQNLAIVIPEGSVGGANMLTVARWVDVQVNWVVLKISGRVYVVSWSILEWNNISFSEMDVKLIYFTTECLVHSTFEATFVESVHIENIAPLSLGEIESCLRLILNMRVVWNLKSISKHDIISLILIGHIIIWEFKEHWFVESATSFMNQIHLSVIVVNETVFDSHSITHDWGVG